MRALLILLVVGLVGVSRGQEDVDERDVIDLTPSNFDQTIAKYPNILVEFYAPWCGHCKQLKPHYAKAATKLKKEHPEVALAKVDADAHKELGTKFGVRGFPTLKWFVNGEPTDYEGGRTDDAIVTWIKKRMGPAAVQLNETSHLDDFKNKAEVVVVGFLNSKEGDAWKEFEKVAKKMDDVEFGVSHEKSVHEHAKQKGGDVVLYKKFSGDAEHEAVVYSGAMNAADIESWIGIHQLPFVVEFSAATSGKIFGSPIKSQVLLFCDVGSSSCEEAIKTFKENAKANYGKIIAVLVRNENDNVLNYFGVDKEETPCVFIAKSPSPGEKGMSKYKGPTKDTLTKDGELAKFLSSYLNGELKPHRKSEKLPANVVDEHGVTTLVGANFDEIVMDPSKDVLVEFYAPWCGHCKQLAPIYDKLGKEFQDIDSVVIAKMDATANDPPSNIDVQGFPTIKFFKATDKTSMDYNGDRTVKGFRKFIKQNAGTNFELKKKGKKKAAEKEL
ncbi:hypothetical protein GUITHDRAFT_85427 [Guillardia theta CCMP2712]|uniref:Protein disulfide-isomerase n=2 Tax=Guillardia theta TaxID=55529 RepID=L1JQA2_GUITC|nr:hypothetical protein GUITHDRAFT_85427 [Guillardia theta CCMP2712]EKX50253.1 hypothetical protein GUITHDRAFT_85427 [Guillardia theta CCMP2712]|eukprot:XP_005837233.1 hypothetical protein GUITHDRAFT_85427 [Guillardia theta CCMP2712]